MLETIHLSTDPGSLILSICMLKRRLHVPPGMTLQSRGYGLILHGLIQYLLRNTALSQGSNQPSGGPEGVPRFILS